MKSQLIKDKKIIENDWFTSELAKVEEIVKMQAGKVVAFKLSGEDYPSSEQVNKTTFPSTGAIMCSVLIGVVLLGFRKN